MYGTISKIIRAAADELGYDAADLDGKAEIARAVSKKLAGVHPSDVQRAMRSRNKPGRPLGHVCTCPACGRKHKPLKETP